MLCNKLTPLALCSDSFRSGQFQQVFHIVSHDKAWCKTKYFKEPAGGLDIFIIPTGNQ